MRVFSFSQVKSGDFVIIPKTQITDDWLLQIVEKVKQGKVKEITYIKCGKCNKLVPISSWVYKDENGNPKHWNC